MKRRNIIGEFIQEKRVKANLSQWDLAQTLGYSSPQFVSNIERGISTVPKTKIRTFAARLNVSPFAIVSKMREQNIENAMAENRALGRYV